MRRAIKVGLLAALAALCGAARAAEPAQPAIAWGAIRDGLQVGLSFGEPQSAYHGGEMVVVRLHLKNASAQPISFPLHATEQWFAVLDAEKTLTLDPSQGPVERVSLRPGEERAAPGEPFRFLLQPWDGSVPRQPALSLPPGKYRIRCSLPLWIPDAKDPNRSTALRARPDDLTVEVLARPGRRNDVSPRAAEPPAEPLTAWGKAVNGLVLGVRFTAKPHLFRYGEAVSVDVLVRNVSERPLSFSGAEYGPGNGQTPTVVSERGENVPVRAVIYLGLVPLVEHTVKPGETLVLGRAGFIVKPPADAQPVGMEAVLGAAPGKYRLSRYEHLEPAGSEAFYVGLASGTLEFEVAGA